MDLKEGDGSRVSVPCIAAMLILTAGQGEWKEEGTHVSQPRVFFFFLNILLLK